MKKITKTQAQQTTARAGFVELDDQALTLASGGHHKGGHDHKKHRSNKGKAAPGIAKGGCYPKKDRIPTGTGTIPTPASGSALGSATPGARTVRLAT